MFQLIWENIYKNKKDVNMLEKHKVHKGLHFMFKLCVSHDTTHTKLSSSKEIQPGSCVQH